MEFITSQLLFWYPHRGFFIILNEDFAKIQLATFNEQYIDRNGPVRLYIALGSDRNRILQNPEINIFVITKTSVDAFPTKKDKDPVGPYLYFTLYRKDIG
ncbi:hypothetical protein QD47_01220 [Paenibacillus terrae]|uniref:Uncharacterized protein n=1 Tax=Paenibacillus terrae TaxID=159743 RepID=A0A0D7X9A2_9BACL|nr:hypothetical protein QD47_01220 [Paenibacillus terrae]